MNLQFVRGTGVLRLVSLSVVPVLLVAGMGLSGCGKKEAAPGAAASAGPGGQAGGPPPALPVSVVKVEPAVIPISNEWVGTMDGYVNAQIQPQASGYLIKQDYREGSVVQRDQVLFEIDPRPFQAALDQAEGQLGQAKAQLGLAEINVKRDTPLAEAHAIAQSQLDTETQTKLQADASVKTAEANVETAKLNLGWCQVRSLITGVAGQATVQVGNLVNGQSVLTSVSQLDPIKVYFSIGDSEYLALTHQAAKGSNSDLLKGAAKVPLSLTLSNGDEYPAKGHIVFVDRQVNSQTGAIRIAAAFSNPRNVLRPGQFGRVKANTEVRQSALVVPQAAIYDFQGQPVIYTVTADNKVHANQVVPGPEYGEGRVINSGLEPGATVIVDNIQKLKEGMPVNPQPAKQSAGAEAPAAPSAGR